MRALIVVLIFGLAGCTGLIDEEPQESGEWEYEVVPSMAPDFGGDGESYPALLIHGHQTTSEKRQEEMQYVVCADINGQPLEVINPLAADMAPCPPSPYDEATGRVYMDNQTFPSEAPAVAFFKRCSGGVVGFPDDGVFTYNYGGHDFRLQYNGTFSVDGMEVARGTQLKISWVVNPNNDYERYEVKVVFDYPGEWLRSMVYPVADGGLPVQPPTSGAGIGAHIPLDTTQFEAILAPLLAETPATHVEHLRVVRTDALTAVHATLVGEMRYEWYSAAIDPEGMRMLVNITAATEGVALDEVYDYLTLGDLPGAGPLVTDYTFQPNEQVEDTELALPLDGDCETCHYRYGNLMGTQWLWHPLAGLESGGSSFRIEGYDNTGAATVSYASR